MYYGYYMLPDGSFCLAPPPPNIDGTTYYNNMPTVMAPPTSSGTMPNLAATPTPSDSATVAAPASAPTQVTSSAAPAVVPETRYENNDQASFNSIF